MIYYRNLNCPFSELSLAKSLEQSIIVIHLDQMDPFKCRFETLVVLIRTVSVFLDCWGNHPSPLSAPTDLKRTSDHSDLDQ